MRAPSVVLFTSYPIATPRSGGQLRARALVEHYESCGFAVTNVGVFPAQAFPRIEHGAADLEFPLGDPAAFDGVAPPAESDDLQSGAFLARDDARFAALLRKLPSRVDVFHLEQPWLLPVVQRLRALPDYAQARVVYGSQNIEAPLKASICRSRGLVDAPVVKLVADLERAAASSADLVLAVSPADAGALEAMGARRVVLASNGIHAARPNPREVARWRERLGGRRVALFVGSAHPPNADGFLRAFGDAMGFVPPDAVIVIAGRVGALLAERLLERSPFARLNASRVVVTGELDDVSLSALKAVASVFLLPIFEGGGSNIKTSEALLSGRPIIATDVSLRGFDRYVGMPELTVAHDRRSWVRAVRDALVAPDPPTRPVDTLRSALLWEQTLAAVGPAVREIL